MMPCDCPRPTRCAQLAVCQAHCRRLPAAGEAAHAAGLPLLRDGTPADPAHYGVITIESRWPGPGVSVPLAGTPKGRWP